MKKVLTVTMANNVPIKYEGDQHYVILVTAFNLGARVEGKLYEDGKVIDMTTIKSVGDFLSVARKYETQAIKNKNKYLMIFETYVGKIEYNSIWE